MSFLHFALDQWSTPHIMAKGRTAILHSDTPMFAAISAFSRQKIPSNKHCSFKAFSICHAFPVIVSTVTPPHVSDLVMSFDCLKRFIITIMERKKGRTTSLTTSIFFVRRDYFHTCHTSKRRTTTTVRNDEHHFFSFARDFTCKMYACERLL